MNHKIACAVVTFNRRAILSRAVAALLRQTHPLSRILIVDNASTDGTREMLQACGVLGAPAIAYQRMHENVGCAAGFAEALSRLLESDHDWFWLLDDDAVAAPSALQELAAEASDQDTVYCSAAVGQGSADEELCWPATPVGGTGKPQPVLHYRDLPAVCETALAQFLGLLIHRSLVARIGLPDRGFFISGDDAEYSYRMRKQGARILLVKASRIAHPLPKRRTFRVFGTSLHILEQEPWKRYYEVRNRLVIAKRYQGRRLWTDAVPGTLVRWGYTLAYQSERLAQSKAFALGLWHGLRGQTGMCWPPGAQSVRPNPV